MRSAVLPLLGAVALLLTPGAPGLPDIPGDPTPPVVLPVITGTLGDAGWYRSNVTVNWSVTDPESVILSTTGCDTRTLTADTTGTRLSCTAESDGGESSVSRVFKVDKTAPSVTASPSRPPDENGWYNHQLSAGFAGADATSGVASCSAAESYAGPDTAGGSLTGTCRDQAGNTGAGSVPFMYDETPPQATAQVPPADANGWHNHALTVTFQGSDAVSGIEGCTEVTYAGPDDPSVPVSGTCEDVAGNESAASQVTLRYDETPPQASAAASRAADVNGWYNAPLTVTFAGADAMSGLESCDPPKTYGGPDAASTSVSGSCRDLAGNVSPRSYALRYDATPPPTTATPSRQPNAQGWYNAPLGVAFAGADATSGTASCSAAKTYGGPDDGAAAVSGTCVDNAGNVAPASLPLRYDATAPLATATPTRQPNGNGWFNAGLGVAFSGTDATAGIDSCDAAKSYTGPDAPAASLTGTCRDRAGNQSATTSYAFKFDATAPQATATPSRQPNAQGWYNAPLTVAFAGTDGLSGLDSCDAQKTYAGPDRLSASVGGTCLDKAGNTGAASVTLNFDATAPQTTATASRQPNANGWYNAALSVSFAATDATSGVDSCDAAKGFSGPDTSSGSVAGACRDKAGNAQTDALPVRYDATAPQATATPSRQANGNGWYNAPLTVAFGATDATSGVDSCPAERTYSGPDDDAASVGGTCFDKAGNGTPTSLPLRYDATAPVATATRSRQPNANGWYNAPLSIAFAATDATSGLDSCPAERTYSGPDDGAAAVSGTCFDKAGNGALASAPIRYDATAPQAGATPSRQPNANGWYNAPLGVSFSGGDSLSGLDSCPATKTYAGPDGLAAVVSGTCVDKAGNGALASYTLKYDATAPAAAATPSRAPNGSGWYTAPLTVAYSGTDEMSAVERCDEVESYSGPDDAAAMVNGSCTDRAGNVGPASFGFSYDATAPQTSAAPSRAPDAPGWYNHALSVVFTATDATAGVLSCDPAKSYSGPDSASAAVAGACRDKAGNMGGAALELNYDGTAPQAAAVPSRPPNAEGWHNAPLAISFAGTDATAGIQDCDAAKDFVGPDSAGATVGGSCRDRAGNAGFASLVVKYDSTAPQVTANPGRDADENGWYNHPFAVSFAAADPVSGVGACDAPATYAGPDLAAAAVTGGCLDRAGNAGSGSFEFKYDATAPQATATPSQDPNANGWHNAAVTVGFAGADPVSGVASCAAPQEYSGPDTTLALVTGTCRDSAGNSALASIPVRYDATPPEATPSARPPDRNGWYRAPLGVSFAGADATSGVDSCSAATEYAGPDTTGTTLTGACLDRAGNASSSAAFGFRYDATAPQVTEAIPARPPDRAGWYHRPVPFAVRGADGTSGLESCPAATYSGPDTASGVVLGSCFDTAGNVGSSSFALRYDATPPETRAVRSREPDANGWYRTAVSVAFAADDAVSGVESCQGPESYDGPDSSSAHVGGLCIDHAGNAGLGSLAVQFDSTPPQITGVTPDRPADANGWYNRPLEVSFAGSDATSGIESCTRAGYAGPDAAAASLDGSCRDLAGNASTSALFALRYDATAPALSGLSAKAENRAVALDWTAPPDAVLFELRRSGLVVYRGKETGFRDTGLENRRAYRYTLAGFDEAGNAATAGATATPNAPLYAPAAGAKVSAPPRLGWKAVPGATYYNVQLWRRGRILSVWPRRESLQLRRTWTYAGRRHRLTPGRYRWFVWPGLGRPSEKRFGPPVGSSTFVVVR